MTNKTVTERQVRISILMVVLLAIALCVTTYALFYATVSVTGNFFGTGYVSIDLNGGKPIIEAHEYLFEPGMTVEKPFYVQSDSSWAVYFKIYFDKVEGGLADVLEITVLDGDKVLYRGTAARLTRQTVSAADDVLHPGERKDLTIRFHMPKTTGNSAKNMSLAFDFCADAVQMKNNPNREFE